MNPTALRLPSPARDSLADRLAGWRDRLLGSRAFRRFAARFAPTRPLAARAAGSLFDICSGFVYSQVLLACVRLSVFDILAKRAHGVEELADLLEMPAESCARLLDAAAALDLVARRSGGRFGLGPLGAAMLGNDEAAAMIEHNALLYADLADPVARLRAGSNGSQLSAFWPYAGGKAAPQHEPQAESVVAYSRLMTASQARLREQVLDAYPLEWHRCLLDGGGGEGGFALAVAQRYAHLKVKTFDLPPVADRARGAIAHAGLAQRIEAVGGDFFAAPLPAGADIVTLLRVLFDHADDAAVAILKAVRQALPPGGTLLVAEPMAGEAGAQRVGDAYFGMYLLAMGRGRPRSRQALTGLLAEAGFVNIETVRLAVPLGNGLLMARA
jgi:demethylspheroidene O-methyltransferase